MPRATEITPQLGILDSTFGYCEAVIFAVPRFVESVVVGGNVAKLSDWHFWKSTPADFEGQASNVTTVVPLFIVLVVM